MRLRPPPPPPPRESTTAPAARRLAAAIGLLAVFALCGSALAEAPQVSALSRYGLRTGAENDLVLTGRGLTAETRLLLPVPGAKQEVRPGSKPAAGRLELRITLPADAPVGVVPVRPVNDEGAGPLLLIELSAPAEIDEVEPNDDPARATVVPALPAVINGSVAGADIDVVRVTLKGGKRVAAEVVSQRIGMAMEPVLEVCSANGRLLAAGDRAPASGADVRVRFTVPDDGEYTLIVHDLAYRGSGRGAYRLKITEAAGPDTVFPLGGRRGEATTVTFSGGDLPAPVTASATLAVPPHVDRTTVVWPGSAATTGTPFVLAVGDLPEVIESDAAQPLTAPRTATIKPVEGAATLNGRITATREVDRWTLNLPAGKWRAEIAAQSLGSPLLGVLQRHDAKGNSIAEAPDRPDSVDPRLDFDVAAGGAAVTLAVRDLLNRGGPAFAYRLTVSPVGEPDFRLSLEDDLVNIPAGGAAVLRVTVARRGYNGPITLSVPDLPAEVLVDGAVIPAGRTDGLLCLSAPKGTALTAKRLTINGEGQAPGGRPLRRIARRVSSLAPAGGPLVSPWVSADLYGGVVRPGAILLTATPRMAGGRTAPGVPLLLDIAVDRLTKQAGEVKLAIVTDVVTANPKKGNALEQDFVELKTAQSVAAKDAKGVLTVTLDPKTPQRTVQVAVVGTLTDAAGKVLGTATARSLTLTVVAPYGLEVVDAKPAPVPAGGKGSVAAKLVREPGFAGDVEVKAVGLPAGFVSPVVKATAKSDAVSVGVTAPAGAKAGEVSFTLEATWKAEPKNVYKIAPVPAKILVTPPAPATKAEQPKVDPKVEPKVAPKVDPKAPAKVAPPAEKVPGKVAPAAEKVPAKVAPAAEKK